MEKTEFPILVIIMFKLTLVFDSPVSITVYVGRFIPRVSVCLSIHHLAQVLVVKLTFILFVTTHNYRNRANFNKRIFRKSVRSGCIVVMIQSLVSIKTQTTQSKASLCQTLLSFVALTFDL